MFCLHAGAGVGEATRHDRKAGRKVAEVETGPGQAFDFSEILRELVALSVLHV